jgi:two-component system, NtrC family, response regulator GlrR
MTAQERTSAPVRILAVDDDEDVLEVVRLWLESSSFEVITATSDIPAMKAVRTCSIDLSIIDLNLPRRDGISLMQDIHSIVPDMPVIILTGYGSIESAVDAVKKGAYTYLTKPFDPGILVFEISRALENRRLVNEIARLRGLLRAEYDFTNIPSQEKIKTLEEAMAWFEEYYLTKILDLTEGNVGTAAQLAGLSIPDLSDLLKRYHLKPGDFKRS